MQFKDFEIDIEALGENILENTISVDDCFFLEDIKNRRIYINSDIDDIVARNMVFYIMRYNKADKGLSIEERQPIIIYLNSDGGIVSSGLTIVDMIVNSKTPVWIVNTGRCYSMASIIYTAGHKRFSLNNATVMFHAGSTMVYNSSDKVMDMMNFNEQVDDKIANLILDRTNITKKLYNKNKRVEWFLHADEAQKLGIVDCIVGVDCDLDEII